MKSNFKIKLYCDGADLKSMLELSKLPHITGLTTNPSLMKKAGVNDYTPFCKEVLSHIKDKPISFEVFADDFPEMKRQALEISSWGNNVYTKIPVMNSKGENTYALIKELSQKGVKLNVTAILTLEQVVHVCEALKGGAPAIVSIFCGRVADTGVDPVPFAKASVAIAAAAGKQMEVLWASTREVYNIIEAEKAGCQIITVPFDILKKLDGLNKDLHQVSLETVQMFKKDADSVGYKL